MVDKSAKDVEIVPHEGFLEARFLGAFSVDRFKAQVEFAVGACTERGILLLLLDYTRLSPVPGTLERYEISTHGAEAARGLSKLAGLATKEQIGEKFGAMVARNRGLNVDVFTDRQEAVRWLLATP